MHEQAYTKSPEQKMICRFPVSEARAEVNNFPMAHETERQDADKETNCQKASP